MRIEIVAIGNEVLTGMTVNTNTAFLSQELLKMGLTVSRHTALPDEEIPLKQGLQEALSRSRIVLATGGLGPSLDDITRKAAAELFESDFVFDPLWAQELEKRYHGKLSNVQDQATVPRKARRLPNPVGTAQGFIFSNEANHLVLMPGVPLEMKQMWSREVKPFIEEVLRHTVKKCRRILYLFNLSEAAVDPYLRELKGLFPKAEYGIYVSYGLLAVQLLGDSEEDVEQPYKLLTKRYAKHCYEAPNGRIEEAVHQRFIAKGWTLSLAESCTGGQVAARLVRQPGASKYFLGSLVAYSNALKETLLGVPATLISGHGAVSAEVVRSMAAGVQRITGSDFAMAVSGIAGPDGGSPEKPVGTMWAAICQSANVHVWTFQCYGSRDMIIERTVNALLAELLIKSDER